MKPLTITEFAQHIGRDVDEVFELDFEAFVALVRRHGFVLTGKGILPAQRHKN